MRRIPTISKKLPRGPKTVEAGRKREPSRAASAIRIARANASGPELLKQFQELHAQCTAIVMTLGTQREDRPRLGRLRQQAASLGRQLQQVALVNLNHPNSRPPSDPRVPDVITTEEFVSEVRKSTW